MNSYKIISILFLYDALVKAIQLYIETSKNNYVILDGWTKLLSRGGSKPWQLNILLNSEQLLCGDFAVIVFAFVAEMQDGVQFYCRAD